jgi:hypothetical protein
MFPRRCSFTGCDRSFLAKGLCSAHYKQLMKGQPLRPLRPFYGKVRPYGPIGPYRFNELPQVRSGEWELCLATRSTGGWCAGHAAQRYEKRPLKPIRQRRTSCDFPGCSNRHSCRGYYAAHYRQLQRGRLLTPLNLRKGLVQVQQWLCPSLGTAASQRRQARIRGGAYEGYGFGAWTTAPTGGRSASSKRAEGR